MPTIAVPFFMGDPMPGFQVPDPHEVVDQTLTEETPQARMGTLYAHLADRVAATDRPTVFAGDCVSTIGVLAGLERRGLRASLIFFDAHGDFHTWETTHSGFIGGMPVAMLTGRGEQTIVVGAGLTPLSDARVVIVDARDLDPGEDTALADSGVRVEQVADIADRLPDGPLYLHIDADVVDPAEMPAMNYPAPGGPSLEVVAASIERIADTGRVAAFSLSSWNPELPGAGVAAAACARLARPFLDL